MIQSRIKEFDKVLFKIQKGRINGFYKVGLGILIFLSLCTPIVNLSEQIQYERFYFKYVVFLGLFIFISTSSYMNLHVYIKQWEDDLSIARRIPVYKNLKYCPISKKDMFKSRFIYLVKYSVLIIFILLATNCIYMLVSIKFKFIEMLKNIILITLIFGFVPGILSLILETKDKIIRWKVVDSIVKIIIFVIAFRVFIYLWEICLNQQIYYSFGQTTVTQNALNENDERFNYGFFIPDIDKLPKYKNISYSSTETRALIFKSLGESLVVDYDSETYYKEKENLEKQYTLLKDVSNLHTLYDEPVLNKAKFSIGSYDFRVVQKYKGEESYFPKDFGMIGVSDEKKSIAYLSFSDTDLDYIDDIEQFVKDYFKYDFE
ncbi:hypothetical protein [Intestinibacter bartlettii]|uniref:Uncharacterized protein n=1 Tax=Intestinibacter bartlettii TaxID=261299 RepID=A0A6N3EIP8_9FIRM